MNEILNSAKDFLTSTGIYRLITETNQNGESMWWKTLLMLVISGVLVYLAIAKKFEPLLLLPIAIGMLLTNLPGGGMFHLDFFIGEEIYSPDLQSEEPVDRRRCAAWRFRGVCRRFDFRTVHGK